MNQNSTIVSVSTVSTPRFVQTYYADTEAIRAELTAGLLDRQAHVAPKYLYDRLGSKLFEAICELPEYYVTRCETGIFETYLDEIRQVAGQGGTLIDLGAGNCAKAASLFPVLQPAQYVPVDISVEFLRDAVSSLQFRYPSIEIVALGQDFSETLALPDIISRKQRLIFYPGSSIGNFTPQQALVLLRRLHAVAGSDGALLIGADLVKSKGRLDAAYDDALGVTAAFNLNLLLHLNALLGADFNVGDWRHRAAYCEHHRCVEMHLEARRNVSVRWGQEQRHFVEGERIHTESSYKYTPESFVMLLEQAGFSRVRRWSDPDGMFMVCHAQACGK